MATIRREKTKNPRELGLIIMFFLFFAAFIGILANIQLVHGEHYQNKIKNASRYGVKIKAARGEILDRNGLPLVTNRQGNSLIFEYAKFPPPSQMEQRAEIIDALIKLCEKNEVEWIDRLPLVLDENGAVAFTENRDYDIKYMKSKDMLNLNEYATAQNCFDELVRRYKLENYPLPQALKIASVSYEMRRQIFNASNPYTFAQDVPGDLVAIIKENSTFYRGVEPENVPYRVYEEGTLAPHIIGLAGAISAEEYKKHKDEGYGINDVIGKTGLEYAMENELRGKDGLKTVTVEKNGNVTSETTQPPQQGNTVISTIDSNLQRAAQESLEKFLTSEKTDLPPAGAAVVIKVHTGEILACATYPSYDISLYNKEYNELSKQAGAPLWNRALMSAYECGSTMKPSVAIAGLEEGLITKDSRNYCSGTYVYGDSTFKCEQSHVNRNLNVVYAIKESCNTFFYELGRRLGISKINQYRSLLGMGQKTGVEIGEVSGVLDSPEYRSSLGQTWLDGFTVQSAIGQSSNLVTPIQLANYCAVIANGGTLYQPHFVKTVKTFDYSQTVLEKERVVKWETGFSKNTLDIVREGMFLLGTDGYMKSRYANVPVNVGVKTGTSQVYRNVNGVSKKQNNVFIICYAPAEKPEIAIATVAEGFRSSAASGVISAGILEAYFADSSVSETVQFENVLLG